MAGCDATHEAKTASARIPVPSCAHPDLVQPFRPAGAAVDRLKGL